MSKSEKICKFCNEKFFVENREINRGGGKFCSPSCGAKFNNEHRNEITKSCSYCEHDYKTKMKKSLYCSHSCCRKAREERESKKGILRNPTRSVLQRQIIKYLGKDNFICFVCGWNEASCDIHHINPRVNGGKNDVNNLTVLCPNHHRLADRGILTNLPSVSERYRTISSSK